MSGQMDKTMDYSAGTAAATAPAWVPVLSSVNTALTTLSLVIGIAFVVWRWYRAAGKGGDGD